MPFRPATPFHGRRFRWVGLFLAMAAVAASVELSAAWLEGQEWLRREERFRVQTVGLEEEMAKQISRTEDLLRAAHVLFTEGGEPDQARWDAFGREVGLAAHYPAIRSIQWVPRVARKDLPGFETRMRKIHGAGFRVWSMPGGPEAALPPADAYFPIALVHPRTAAPGGLGFDVYSRASTRNHVVKAVLLQRSMRIGNKLDLVEAPGTTAFGLTEPIFDPLAAKDGDKGHMAREEALRGLATCMFDSRRFFESISATQSEPLVFAVFEGQGAMPSSLLWSGILPAGGKVPRHERFSCRIFHGRAWTLHFQSTPDWEAMQPPGPARLVRIFGLALTAAFGALLAMLLLARERALRKGAARVRDLEKRNVELLRKHKECSASMQAHADLFMIMNFGLHMPLTALRGVLSILGEEGSWVAPAFHRNLLAQARHNAERALALLNGLLDLQRLERRELPLIKVELDLRTALQEAVEGSKGMALAQSRTVLVECSGSLRVLADPKRLHQVLNNLLGNALRYSPEGSLVRLWAESVPEGRVRVSIHNEGRPLPEAVRARMSGPSRFAPASASPPKGLGLPLSKSLVEAMGGAMGYVNAAGGNTFWFELPGRA